ncbi:MAG: methyltransferase [Anaerolineales bacterium]|jgi:protein-S-isoprenylcysteine O-methyltransferase Ste14
MSQLPTFLLGYFLLLAISLVVLSHFVPRDYRRLGKLSPPVAVLQSLLFFVFGGFPTLYLEHNWPAVSVPRFIHVLGLFLLLGGLAVLLYEVVHLGISRSIGRGTPELEQSGLYSLSRNPQAIACGLYVAGFAMLWPSWYAAAWALLFSVLIHMMVLAEEQHLKRTHGRKYEDFCRKVPRYFRWQLK